MKQFIEVFTKNWLFISGMSLFCVVVGLLFEPSLFIGKVGVAGFFGIFFVVFTVLFYGVTYPKFGRTVLFVMLTLAALLTLKEFGVF